MGNPATSQVHRSHGVLTTVAMAASAGLLAWALGAHRMAPVDASGPSTPTVHYAGNAVSEYYFDPTGFFCAFGVTASTTGAAAGEDFYLEVGILLDKSSANPDVVLVLDPSFQPLVIQGTPVLLELAPCTAGGSSDKCKVSRAIPPPSSHRWIQFRSTERLPASPGDSKLDFVVEAHWPNELTTTVRSTDSGVWVSDDRDDVHGYSVTDYHEKGPFPYMIPECMGRDREAHVVFVNGTRGPFVTVGADQPLALSIARPHTGGNGKFMAHLDAGVPDPFSVTAVGFGLGDACFPMLLPPAGTATPVSVWNNVGKEVHLGTNHYFGASQDAPARAPTFFHMAPSGDTSNLPSGSQWTVQGIIVNPAAANPRSASITNVVEIAIE